MISPAKVMLFLAASELTDKELIQFFQWCAKQNPKVIADGVFHIRNYAESRLELQQVFGSSRDSINSIKSSEQIRIDEHRSMIEEVEKLLLKDAKLTKSEATRILLDELQDAPTQYGYLAQPNKISFRSWLARLGEDVSDSRVLHVASRVRNSIVHGSRIKSDWPI